jgi:hypothetical protein
MMAGFDPLAQAGAKARGKRPWFYESREAERVMNITMALAQEVAVMRARMDTTERLLEARGLLSRAEIEAYEPSKAEAAERGAWTQEFIARILRIVQQENEAAEVNEEMSSEDAGRELGLS